MRSSIAVFGKCRPGEKSVRREWGRHGRNQGRRDNKRTAKPLQTLARGAGGRYTRGYGTSPVMLINCVAYENGRKLSDITVEAISDYLDRPGCFVWVALKDPGPGELAVMAHEFGLHELAVEDARKTNQRPKIDEYGDQLFTVLKTIEVQGDEFHVGELDVFVGPNFVLSVRNGTQRGFTDVRNRCEREPHLLKQGSGFVFYAIMDAVVDRYFPVLDELEAE